MKKRYQYFIPLSVVTEVQRKRLEDPRRGRALPSLESAYCRLLQDAIRDYCENIEIRAGFFADFERIPENDKTLFQDSRLPLKEGTHEYIKVSASNSKMRLYDFANLLFLQGIKSFDYSQL